MRLPRPLPDLRRHATPAGQKLEETKFAICRSSTVSDPDAGYDTTGHHLNGSPALLSERPDGRPLSCASPSVPPGESDRPPQGWFLRWRTWATTWEARRGHPSVRNRRSTGTTSTPTVANVKTAWTMGAIGLLVLMVMACGPGDAPTAPDAGRPTVVTATQSETASNAAGNGQQAQTAKSENEQPRDSDSSGNDAPKSTDKPDPTPAPTATVTPEPTPTATVVPTPTPDPKVTLFNLLRGFSRPTEVPEYPYLRDHNVELIKKAVAPYVADYVRNEYSDLIWDSKETIQGRVPYYINSERVEFEQIPSDGKELHVRVTMQYLQTLPGAVENLHQVTVDAAIASAEPPYEAVGLTIPAHHEGHLDRAPIFSRLLGDPVIAAGQQY